MLYVASHAVSHASYLTVVAALDIRLNVRRWHMSVNDGRRWYRDEGFLPRRIWNGAWYAVTYL